MAISERPKIGKLIFEGIFGKKDNMNPGKDKSGDTNNKRGKRGRKKEEDRHTSVQSRELYTDR